MRCLATLRRARAATAAAAAAGVVATAVCLAPAASADTSADADAKVRQILAKVEQIRHQVDEATKAYDDALAGVAGSVNAAIVDGRTSEEVTGAADAARAQLADRVRGLYMSGGPLALYATLLDAQDPAALQEQAVVVDQVVSSDRLVVASADEAALQASHVASASARRARASIRTERSVALVAARVTGLLAQEEALLAEARAHAASVHAAEEALAAQRAALASVTAADLARLHAMPASPSYMALYRRAVATECPRLSWTVLAAVGQVESGHGRDVSTSYAGAMGPMQFLPSTFGAYAVDGDHDGKADIMSAPDAIFTAARYLCANGAGGSAPDAVARAIWHYNHADWYVQMVLTLAQQYAA